MPQTLAAEQEMQTAVADTRHPIDLKSAGGHNSTRAQPRLLLRHAGEIACFWKVHTPGERETLSNPEPWPYPRPGPSGVSAM